MKLIFKLLKLLTLIHLLLLLLVILLILMLHVVVLLVEMIWVDCCGLDALVLLVVAGEVPSIVGHVATSIVLAILERHFYFQKID